MKPVTRWAAGIALALLLAAAPVWFGEVDELDALQASADDLRAAQRDARSAQRLANSGMTP